jgi:hypothetical protein
LRTSNWRRAFLIGSLALATSPTRGADINTSPAFFDGTIRPMVNEFCLGCHSTAKHKGDMDLERFSSLSEVKKHPKVWQQVIEQLSLGEMPPKEKPQPTAAQRTQLLAWINAVLDEVALARAGDPGPVVLRRLSNAEYTYTIRDLTAVNSLDPAREFPVDGAAGEGFMNVGNALVMSPSLITKYLDAGKEIASHAMLSPDGIRFSPKNTRRDWTEEILAEIRRFYGRYSEAGGGLAVNLQGIQFDTRDGGVIPLQRYLAVLVKERNGQAPDSLRRGLSEKYLRALRDTLSDRKPSIVLDPIRARYRSANANEAGVIVAEIQQWQRALWKFNSVGHLGKVGGPKEWLELSSPVAFQQDVRLKLPAATNGEVTLYLVASDAGDGNENDFVVWREPRLIAPGRPVLLLRDVREVMHGLTALRERTFASTAKALAAAAEAAGASKAADTAELAQKHGVEADVLSAWLAYLGIGGDAVRIDSHFTNTFQSESGYDFIKGWNSGELPNLVANSSDQHVRIPGNMKPHSVAVHPSPKLQAVVGWRSPVAGTFRVAATIQHAHPECGNGVTWSIELRRGSTRQRLSNGVAQDGGKLVKAPPLEIAIRKDDLVSLSIGPRDGNHWCDLTAIDLVLTNAVDSREWSLSKDVSPDVSPAIRTPTASATKAYGISIPSPTRPARRRPAFLWGHSWRNGRRRAAPHNATWPIKCRPF